MEKSNLSPTLCSQNYSRITESTLVGTFRHQEAIAPHLNISIVSNSHLLCEAIALLLNTHQSVHLLNSYAGDAEIVPGASNPPEHLVLLDSGMGRDLTMLRIQQWRSLEPSPYIVVLELKNELDLILDCIEIGANGYALQGASSTEVIQVIEQVYRGTVQCSPEITTRLFERLSQAKNSNSSQKKPPLTHRELEVLHWITKGCSDRQIAAELVIEVRTVKHHVHNILRKLNVKHRWDAAQLALKSALLS